MIVELPNYIKLKKFVFADYIVSCVIYIDAYAREKKGNMKRLFEEILLVTKFAMGSYLQSFFHLHLSHT